MLIMFFGKKKKKRKRKRKKATLYHVLFEDF